MNSSCEMWSLPWHALQRNLALGLSGDLGLSDDLRLSSEVPGFFKPALKSLKLQGVAVSASSWMSRVQRPRQPPVPTQQ